MLMTKYSTLIKIAGTGGIFLAVFLYMIEAQAEVPTSVLITLLICAAAVTLGAQFAPKLVDRFHKDERNPDFVVEEPTTEDEKPTPK
jgi:hypothetical protein